MIALGKSLRLIAAGGLLDPKQYQARIIATTACYILVQQYTGTPVQYPWRKHPPPCTDARDPIGHTSISYRAPTRARRPGR